LIQEHEKTVRMVLEFPGLDTISVALLSHHPARTAGDLSEQGFSDFVQKVRRLETRDWQGEEKARAQPIRNDIRLMSHTRKGNV
jgi:hypothetical protein